MAEKLNKANMRQEVSKLVRLLGLSRISGRRFGHYNPNNLGNISYDNLKVIYEDLSAIYKQKRRTA